MYRPKSQPSILMSPIMSDILESATVPLSSVALAKEEVVPAGDSPADPHIPGNACVSRAVFGVPPNTFRIPRNPASIALNAATNYD